MRQKNFHKFAEEKKIRRLYTEYKGSWKKSKDSGHFVEVNPYQRGWIRVYDLRDDIKNRKDAIFIRQMLDMLNSQAFCRTKDFAHKSWTTGEMIPFKQPLKTLTPEKYEKLSDRMKKHFVLRQEYVKYSNVMRNYYAFVYDYWFVFKIKPNIVTHHWIPDGEVESRYQKLRDNLFGSKYLWPKAGKAAGFSVRGRDDWYDTYKNADGYIFTEDDFDYNEEKAA